MPYHLATPQQGRFLHGLQGLRNTGLRTVKTLRGELEPRPKRSYNPPHCDRRRTSVQAPFFPESQA